MHVEINEVSEGATGGNSPLLVRVTSTPFEHKSDAEKDDLFCYVAEELNKMVEEVVVIDNSETFTNPVGKKP